MLYRVINFGQLLLGLSLSGVGIAIVTLIIGTLNPKGYIDEISRKISPVFAIVYLVALYLSIGPFFAIPRTATVSFEVGQPLIRWNECQFSTFHFTLVYFLLAFLIALNPSKILDRIGRILTPIFAILILILVVLGALKYSGHVPMVATKAYQASAFGQGF